MDHLNGDEYVEEAEDVGIDLDESDEEYKLKTMIMNQKDMIAGC